MKGRKFVELLLLIDQPPPTFTPLYKPVHDGGGGGRIAGPLIDGRLAAIVVGCDGRRCAAVEVIADADLHLLLIEMAIGGVEHAHRRRRGRVPHMAEVRVAIFASHRPMRVDGIFDAAADRPAEARHGTLIGGVKGGKVRCRFHRAGRLLPNCADGDAGRPIEQHAVERIAGAGANRALDLDQIAPVAVTPTSLARRVGIHYRKLGTLISRRAAHQRRIDRALEADDPFVELLVVAEMRAADHADRIAVEIAAAADHDGVAIQIALPGEAAGRRIGDASRR